MNIEPSFLIIGLELVSTRSYSNPGMTNSYFCHDAKGGGVGLRLNVMVTLIFFKVWKCPLRGPLL